MTKKRSAIADWPVVRFRPPGGISEVERYDETTGKWKLDDGQQGLAFSAKDSSGFPMAYYAEVPYRSNVTKAWHTQDRKEPSGRLWHYETRDGVAEFGEPYEDKRHHPNELASRAAMDRTASKWGCANGRVVVDMNKGVGNCAWCANCNLGHLLDKARAEHSTLQGQIARYAEMVDELKTELAYVEDLLEQYTNALPKAEQAVKSLEGK
jgi:hypothetical protein